MKHKFDKILGGFLMLLFLPSMAQAMQKTIVIDVGHGGIDPGVISKVANVTERSLVMNIAQKILEVNKDKNLHLMMTRYTDRSMDIKDRANKINEINPDFAISLHIGAVFDKNSQINGISIYYSKESIVTKESKELAHKMFNCLAQGKLGKHRVDSLNSGILRRVNTPTILIEMGFLTNPSDRNYLISKQGQDELAKLTYGCLKAM